VFSFGSVFVSPGNALCLPRTADFNARMNGLEGTYRLRDVWSTQRMGYSYSDGVHTHTHVHVKQLA
jgi:hypothetical protein